MSDLIGQQWGNYQLARLLSRGGIADRYAGNHVRFKTSATLEIFHAQLASEGVMIFQREAQSLVQLLHPHILRLLDFDIQEGRAFFVLDDAPNGSLQERHPSGRRVPLEQVSLYVRQVASALQYAHERNLVHGAIQPEHMLLNAQNEIVLSDFGMLAIAPALVSTNVQASMGALAYMAPEQIQGQALPASDQYALAVAVYQWLCGAWPFQGSPAELVARHLSLQPPPLSRYAPELAGVVEPIVLRALEKDPARRFASVQAFAQALELAGQGVGALLPAYQAMSAVNQPTPGGLLAPPPPIDSFQTRQMSPSQSAQPQALVAGSANPGAGSAAQVPARPARGSSAVSRRKLLTVLGASVAGLGAVVGVGVLIAQHQGNQSNQGNTLTGTPAGTLISVYRSQQYAGDSYEGSAIALCWSPDSQNILSIGGKDNTFECWTALTGAHLTTYRPLGSSLNLNRESLPQRISWTQQDPRYLWLDDPIIHVIDVMTGQELYTVNIASPDSSSTSNEVYWSPNGSLYASIETSFRSASAVHVRKASDGSSVSSFHPKYTGGADSTDWIKEAAARLIWSPDSSRILSWGEDNILYIWNASSGALIFSIKRYAQLSSIFGQEGIAWSPDGKYIASSSPTEVEIWKAEDGSIVSSYTLNRTPYQQLASVCWSPDSQILAVEMERTVAALTLKANTPVFSLSNLNASGSGIQQVVWSPDSQRLATATQSAFSYTGGDPLFTVWDAHTGKQVATYADSDQSTSLANLAWSPDGKHIAVQRTDSLVEIWKVA